MDDRDHKAMNKDSQDEIILPCNQNCCEKYITISKKREILNNIVTQNLKHVVRLVETIQEHENIIFDLENMFLGKIRFKKQLQRQRETLGRLKGFLEDVKNLTVRIHEINN